jgi:5-methylcytosine-specific restriction endonuclease McrA
MCDADDSRECRVCGDAFHPKTKNMLYCSVKCRRACETKRRDRSTEPSKVMVCMWCGLSFNARLTEVNRGRGMVCSLRCAAARGEYLKRGRQGYSEPVVYAQCKRCGSTFVKRNAWAYCSAACAAYVPRPDRVLACAVCGKQIVMVTRGRARMYCSRVCYHKTDAYRLMKHNRRMRNAGTIGSHTAAEWRARLDEYGGKCAHCRKRKATTKDHVVPRSRGGTDYISNVIPSCRKCNCEMKRDLMPNDEWYAERGDQLALVIW